MLSSGVADFRRKGTSLKLTIHAFCAFLLVYGFLLFFIGGDAFFKQGALPSTEVLKQEIESTKTLHFIGGWLLAVSFAGSLAALLSHERWLTFLVLVCLAAAQGILGELTHGRALSWNDSMEAGRAVHFAGGVEDAHRDWHELRAAFEDEWLLCGGGAYNASLVLRSIGEMLGPAQQQQVAEAWVRKGVPVGHKVAREQQPADQYALFCPPPLLSMPNASQPGGQALGAAAAAAADPDGDNGAWLLDSGARGISFARLVNAYCLSSLGTTRPADAVDRTCYDSDWWQANQSAAPPAAARSALLGDAEVVNAKLLFCLCELSPDYVLVLREVDLALGGLAYTLLSLTWVPIIIIIYFSLCTQDRDEYYDPDLL
jgi:hypothetical protein